ncbi:MAG: tryptophan synthase subunit alpha [bacterium]|nr:tryptophan synthase subunit alpha [bacterium]
MNRIDERFVKLRNEGKVAFIPFITCGDPSLSLTPKLVLELEKGGADIVELGVPFSEPLADGKVIQGATERALKNKVTLSKVIDLVKDLRKETDIPIVLLSYYNPIYRYGIVRFVEDAVRASIDGVIIPDLPPEEADILKEKAMELDFATIFLVSPTSTEHRIKLITRYSTGFIYYVSLEGTTGMRERLEETIQYNIETIRAFTNKPIGVGFGIGTEDQARRVAEVCDAVIVGSAIVSLIDKNKDNEKLLEIIGGFARKLSIGIKKVRK